MFDIFDILVPKLGKTAGVEVRQRQTEFGQAEERYLFIDGLEFGRVYQAQDLYDDVVRWTGSQSRAAWTVITVPGAAYAAANNDDTWANFLASLTQLLQAQSQWITICESDCDQTTVEELELSASEVSALLDSYRTTNFSPIAIKVIGKQ